VQKLHSRTLTQLGPLVLVCSATRASSSSPVMSGRGYGGSKAEQVVTVTTATEAHKAVTTSWNVVALAGERW
jgi:hypothetical protein